MTTATAIMTPAQARAACDSGLHALGTARWLLTKLIENLTPEQWMHQPRPGMNHVMFNVGHIAFCDCGFLQFCGGRSSAVPAEWESLFNMGCKPLSSASDYPSPQEVTVVLKQVRDDFNAHLTSLPDARLLDPVKNDMLVDIVPSIAHLPAFMTMHDGTHIGQVLSIRQALKLPGVLGME